MQALRPDLPIAGIHEPGGCAQCGGSGYRGRIAIGEFVASTPALSHAISLGSSGEALNTAARRHMSLADDGLARVAAGDASLDGVERVLGEQPLREQRA